MLIVSILTANLMGVLVGESARSRVICKTHHAVGSCTDGGSDCGARLRELVIETGAIDTEREVRCAHLEE